MNKNKIFSAIMRGFEVSGINALSSAAGSSSVNGALQEIIEHPPLIWTPHTESFLKKPGTRLKKRSRLFCSPASGYNCLL